MWGEFFTKKTTKTDQFDCRINQKIAKRHLFRNFKMCLNVGRRGPKAIIREKWIFRPKNFRKISHHPLSTWPYLGQFCNFPKKEKR